MTLRINLPADARPVKKLVVNMCFLSLKRRVRYGKLTLVCMATLYNRMNVGSDLYERMKDRRNNAG